MPVWAIVLIALFFFGCFGFAVLAAILFPVFAQAREAALKTVCLSNVKQQALGALMYANDFDNRLPPDATWMDTLAPYTKNPTIFKCSKVAVGQFGYAMNHQFSGANTEKTKRPETLIILFESQNTSRNAIGDPKTDQCVPRHMGQNSFGFMDGHARSASPSLASATPG